MNNRQPIGQIPLLGQSPNSVEAARIAVRQVIGQLSLGIYSQAAVQLVSSMSEELVDEDLDRLKVMALNSRAAAKVYYEALGIRFEE